nr:MORC family CW-type zinc finger protein [Ipomoea batatas]
MAGSSTRRSKRLRRNASNGVEGESPPSSASDVDNLNNSLAVDKVASAKGVGSPQVTSNTSYYSKKSFQLHVAFLNFEVSFAMDASRKSIAAFAAANPRKGEALCKEGMLSVRKALDFQLPGCGWISASLEADRLDHLERDLPG